MPSPGRCTSLWEILKVSDDKGTHHFHQKGAFGLDGELSSLQKDIRCGDTQAHRHRGSTSASSRHIQSKSKIANGCQARYHRSWCAGAAMHGHRSAQTREWSPAWPIEKAKEPSNGGATATEEWRNPANRGGRCTRWGLCSNCYESLRIGLCSHCRVAGCTRAVLESWAPAPPLVFVFVSPLPPSALEAPGRPLSES